MNHILNVAEDPERLQEIFKQIQMANTILFLGAGASVGEKKYLSKEIIDYYESLIGKNVNEKNITKFIDILSANKDFSRSQFDAFVVQMLQKLTVTDAHRVMATIPWRQIITTNYDLLVERAYDEIEKTHQKVYDLKTIKTAKQYTYRESNTEVKYIKLNGCIQDASLYPLAFSTDDFNRLKPFYKMVLNDLKNLSPAISFLTIGYSFSDDFGQALLEKFDSYNYREKKWIINVDPFPNESAYDYYTKNKICIIKCSFQEFFERYKSWELNNSTQAVKRKGLYVHSSTGGYIPLPPKLLINLDGCVKQLDDSTKDRQFIKDIDYYKGEEPTFGLINRGVDVVKADFLSQFMGLFNKVLSSNDSTFVPVFFVTGDFGIGKSTFSLRLIRELERMPELELIAFEIVDFNNLKKEFLIDLVRYAKAKHIVFYCDEIEIESSFKGLLDIQRDLSIEQFQDCNVSFVVPVRENILEKYKLTRKIPSSHEFSLTGKFSQDEISELLDKLKTVGLVEFRDASEKRNLLKKVQKEYDSDSFVSLMAIITQGKHENDLYSSYYQLSAEAQKAFLYTALLHKYKLLMPASWLKQNILMDWDSFTTKVVKAEGKGILIQEIRQTKGTQPDLYFRTKHPLIASKLVERLLPNKDKQFTTYEQMLRKVETGQTNSYLVNNLLKAFVRSGEYADAQLNKLFDSAFSRLSDDPYFLLNYAINLQKRGTKSDLKKALELLVYAEGLLENRNHRFIHRRAVLNFELAKKHFQEETVVNLTRHYLNEAQSLFATKQLLDPFSAYSYVDYIKMFIWELEHIEFEDMADEMQKQIIIEDLLDTASKTVIENTEKINTLHAAYASYLETKTDCCEYQDYLEGLYEQPQLRPYACILLYTHHSKKNNVSICKDLLLEMESYQDNFEVVKFLFKYYGRNLYEPNLRVKFLRLSRENPDLEKDNPLRYNYFNFIAESYNNLYYEGKRYLSNIKAKYYNLNPEFHNVWCQPDGSELIFDAQVVKNDKDKFKAVKIVDIQLTTRLIKGNYDKYIVGSPVNIKIHFYLYGLMAEIIDDGNNGI